MSNVFVVDTYEKPLDPVRPGRARLLLKQGKASVWRRFPFTLILKTEVKDPVVQPLRLKLDPGSRTTGIAIVNDASGDVVFAAELSHRGQHIKERLDARRAFRRNRRARKTRYRKARFHIKHVVPLLSTATGHGRRQMCIPDKYGFPGPPKERHTTFRGYRTGDIVKANTPKGTFQGRIAIRHRPSFRLGKVDIHPKYLRRVHRADGYSYEKGGPVAPSRTSR